jgi:hypothetical protein
MLISGHPLPAGQPVVDGQIPFLAVTCYSDRTCILVAGAPASSISAATSSKAAAMAEAPRGYPPPRAPGTWLAASARRA